MDSENDQIPVPHWTVCKEEVTDPPTGKNIEPKIRTTYYWKLQNPGGFSITRYYPARFSGDLDWCFIPKHYWDILKTTPNIKSSNDWWIEDARKCNGDIRTVQRGIAEIMQKLRDGQECFSTMGKENKFFITGPDHVNTSDGRFVTFDKETPPAKLYVRLRDKDVRAMTLGDHRSQPEEIYIDRTQIERYADDKEYSGMRFEIRTGDGVGCYFQMIRKVCLTANEWTARRNRAINSLDKDGGWNRMINPKLKLFLVPVSPEFNLQQILDLIPVIWTKKYPKCEQTWEVLTREVLDKDHAVIILIPSTRAVTNRALVQGTLRKVTILIK